MPNIDSTTLVARQIRARMRVRGENQREFAGHIRMARETLNRKLTGDSRWTLEELDRVANYLGIHTWELFREDIVLNAQSHISERYRQRGDSQ